jgi:hypothetical protein
VSDVDEAPTRYFVQTPRITSKDVPAEGWVTHLVTFDRHVATWFSTLDGGRVVTDADLLEMGGDALAQAEAEIAPQFEEMVEDWQRRDRDRDK